MRVAPLVAAAFLLAAPAVALADETLITVTGTGAVSAVPDVARINIGVRSDAQTAQEATAANAETMQSVFAVLSDLDVAEEDIQTDRVALSPRWVWDQGMNGQDEQRLVGYDAINMVHVTVREIARVGPVLDMLVAAGANESAGIAFDIEDDKALLDTARRMAVAEARRKAALYAEAAGVSLGSLRGLKEASAFGMDPMMAFGGMAMAAEAGPTPVAPGETTLSVTITASWAIADD